MCVCLCLYELWVCAFTLILNYFCWWLVVVLVLCHKHSMKYAALVIAGMTAGVSAFAPAGASISLRSPCTVRTHQRKQICKCTYNQMLSPSTKCSLPRLPARARAHTHTVIFSRSCALSCSLSRSLISHLTISIVLSTNCSLQHGS